MIDTGATNNFMSRRVADRLGLIVTKNSTRLKAVNSDAMPIYGSAVSSLKVGTWQAECNFTVVNLDDFDLILCIEFLGLAKAFVAPHIKGILIGDERSPYFVHVVSKGPDVGKSKEIELQTAKQFKAGVKRGEQAYVAASIEIKAE
ncbi:Aspartic peptidase domain containing protein [Parasponia andersonii]|uniref:Aspartic peptidase domain containing protein n=1 Tax=Parasponia andersonii TaxID=3476 RepID=A0A2P5BM60_PARAD|nr:Aspartic peptidase domain containing protein [Parasponia andersonii]